MTYKLIHGDCFEEMGKLESSSFDLILTDPPYGTMKGAQDRLNGIDLKGQTSIFSDFSLLEDKK